MSSHATADDTKGSVPSTIRDLIPADVWTIGASCDRHHLPSTATHPVESTPSSSALNNGSQTAESSLIPFGGRRAKTWLVNYFKEGVSYTTELVDGKKRGHLVFAGPSSPGTMTAAIESDGSPDISRAFVTLKGGEGEEDTIICMKSDVPVKTFCFSPSPEIGYIGWGGSELPRSTVGIESFRAAHAIAYSPVAPAPKGSTGLVLNIPPYK
jgi:hypothetical protein